jgi:hypothetical protein
MPGVASGDCALPQLLPSAQASKQALPRVQGQGGGEAAPGSPVLCDVCKHGQSTVLSCPLSTWNRPGRAVWGRGKEETWPARPGGDINKAVQACLTEPRTHLYSLRFNRTTFPAASGAR